MLYHSTALIETTHILIACWKEFRPVGSFKTAGQIRFDQAFGLLPLWNGLMGNHPSQQEHMDYEHTIVRVITTIGIPIDLEISEQAIYLRQRSIDGQRRAI